MPDVMVIVSKAVFEKSAGKHPQLGTKLGMDRYVSANKGIAPVAEGGKLYLVTVRPPDESLWLVAVLEHPEFDDEQWIAKAATTPITDISSLRSKIKFESGKGITANPGALGMSLQTPRVLTEADAELIDALLPHDEPTGEGFPDAPKGGIPANTGERQVGNVLLQQIIDDPFNDLARQVYADALQARNEPRGELIQLELALAGPLSIRRREHLKARRDELVAAHGEAWFVTKLAHRTRAGFISAVTGPFAKVNAEATELFATHPVVEAMLTSVAVDKLARAPWLRHLRVLVLREVLDQKKLAGLFAAAGAQQLTELNLTATGVKGATLAALESYLPALRALVLTSNGIKDEGVAQLVAWPHLANLDTLYLSECGLTGKGVAKLLAKPLPNLAKLTLSKNALDNAVATTIAKAAAHLPKLEYLELIGTKLDGAAIAELQQAKLPSIRRIDVRRTKVGEAEVASLPLFRAGRA